MTTTIMGVGGRRYEMEGDNEVCPGSVFVIGPQGLCVEFERHSLVQALKAELGLYEPLAADWERALYLA